MPSIRKLKKVQIKFFTIITFVIFIAELIIMWILSSIDFKSLFIEMIADSLLLTLLTSPIIYYYLVCNILIKNVLLLSELEHQVDSLNIAALVSETDVNGIITKVNDQFCNVSGYKEAALIGKTHQVVNSGQSYNKW